MLHKFRDRPVILGVILVTGSTDGIGLETALELANIWHALVLHGRNEEKVQRASNVVRRIAPDAVLHTAHAAFEKSP